MRPRRCPVKQWYPSRISFGHPFRCLSKSITTQISNLFPEKSLSTLQYKLSCSRTRSSLPAGILHQRQNNRSRFRSNTRELLTDEEKTGVDCSRWSISSLGAPLGMWYKSVRYMINESMRWKSWVNHKLSKIMLFSKWKVNFFANRQLTSRLVL